VNNDPNDDVTLSMIPPPPPLAVEAAATSEAPLLLPMSASFLSSAAEAGENIAVKGDPNFDMTDLKSFRWGFPAW
jgi:hypothetical protein